ncbi:hypothetical protein AB0K16_22455 [Nonomuraea jabiensis]|uniref:hypothetical protein n=1 Tax=Nonomuraea jabiensis TaxID=882448 RepID=UPI003426BD40
MPDAKVVVAVAGGAPVTKKNVSALLKDWLRIDQDDEREFLVYLPVAEALTTEAVQHTADWLADIDGGYSVVHVDPTPRKLRSLVKDADDAYQSDNVADDLITKLVEARGEGAEVYLLLAWGDDSDGPDEDTVELLDMAYEENITILDLTMGLQELRYDDDSESAEDVDEPEEEPEPPKKKERRTRELKAEEKELTEDKPDEAQAELSEPQKIRASKDTPVFEPADLATTLACVAQFLDGYERMFSSAGMVTHTRGPLNESVRHHLSLLLADSGPTAESTVKAPAKSSKPVQETLPEAAEEKPARRRGKPRDTSSDVLTVYVMERDKKVKIAGRGRAPRNSEKREMTRAEYEEMLEDGYEAA